MKKHAQFPRIQYYFLFLFLIFSTLSIGQTETEIPLYEDGTIYLKIVNSSNVDLTSNIATNSNNPEEIRLLFEQYEVTKVEKPFVIFDTPQFDRSYKIFYDKSCDPGSFMDELRGLSYIQYVERVPTNTIFQCDPEDIPQDDFDSYQLDLIQACDAFNLHKGGSRIAIVDNNVYTVHEDLEANVVAMYDATDGDMDLGNPNWVFGHGTHVAGIACAVTDNSIGVSSIGWNNQLIAVKTTNFFLGITHGYEGIAWAAAEGDADIINLSWGGPAPSEMNYSVILAARDEGSIIVAAAGNEGNSIPQYPAAYGEGVTNTNWPTTPEIFDKKLVIAVANLTQSGSKNTSTSFGSWVDISAYGTGILSSAISPSNELTYGYSTGTSMAAPLVAGLVGLMQSYAPLDTDIEIIDCLLNSAKTDIYDPVNFPDNIAGTLGSGVINAYDALRCLNPDCSDPYAVINVESIYNCSGETVSLTASDGINYAWSTGQSDQTISISESGDYSVTVTLNGGCTATASVTILPEMTSPPSYIIVNGSPIAPEVYCGPRTVRLTAMESGSYLWSFQGETTQTVFIPAPNEGELPLVRNYSVTITDVGGCAGEVEVASVQLEWLTVPDVIIASDGGASICLGEELQLTAITDANIFSWNNGATTNPNIFSPSNSANYRVTVTADNGCTNEDDFFVTASEECPDATCSCPENSEVTNIGSDGEITNISQWIPFDNQNNTCLSIKGTIMVDVNVDITYSSIFFGPGAELIVEDGIWLTMQHTRISGCDEMWKGITIQSGGVLVFTSNYISDAQYAVKALDGATIVSMKENTFDRNFVGFYIPPPSQFLGSNMLGNTNPLNITRNDFICSAPLSAPYTGQIPDPGSITYAGLLLNSVNGLDVGSPAPSDYSSCYNLRNGVIAYNSNFSLKGFDIKNLSGTNLDDGVIASLPHSNQISFNHEGIGVYLKGSNGFSMDRVNIDNAFIGVYTLYSDISELVRCDIRNVDRGIMVDKNYAGNVFIGGEGNSGQNAIKCRREGISIFDNSVYNRATITNNQISKVEGSNEPMVGIGIYNSSFPGPLGSIDQSVGVISDNTIALTNNSNNTFDVGIEVSNSGYVKVKDNVLSEVTSPGEKRMISLTGSRNCQIRNNFGLGAGLGSSNASGIFVMNNTRTTYCCNTLNGLEEGVRFSGMCDDTDFRGTTFENITSRGLLLENGTTIGVQGDPNDSETNFLSGNTWDNGGGAEHQGTSIDDVSLSSIFFNPMFGSTIPESVIPVQGWFIPEPTFSPLMCATQVDCNVVEIFSPGVGNIDIQIATNNLYGSLYGGGIAWEGERHLYKNLTTGQIPLEGNQEITNFYADKSSKPLGKLYEIEQDIANLVDLTDPITSRIIEIQNSIRETLASIKENGDFLESSPQSCQTDLIEERAKLFAFLQPLQIEMQELLEIYNQERTLKVDWIIAKNNGINITEIFEANRKNTNDVYLKTIAKGIFQYDTQQLALLESIASQCPLSGGNAVFMARGLLKRVQNVNFNDKELCQETGERRSSYSSEIKVSDSHAITIFPNPSTGKLNLELSKAYDDDLNLTIYSLTGKKLRDLILPSGRKSYNFDLSSLQSGIYLYETIVNGEKMSGKIILIK